MTEFWQSFETKPDIAAIVAQDRYAAPMPDGTGLALPLRDFGDYAVAGFIANQASFAVVDRIADWMADVVTTIKPDVVAGLPTLGHVFASLLARRLGHTNWVALGTTRKLWYDEALSVPLTSITAPGAGRRLWLDPRLLPRLRNRHVLLVDDVISTGASARAGLTVLEAAGTPANAMCVAMAQGHRWRTDWPTQLPLLAAFATPLFRRTAQGWHPVSGSSAPFVP